MTARPGSPAGPTPAGHPIFLLEKPGDTGKTGVHAGCKRAYQPPLPQSGMLPAATRRRRLPLRPAHLHCPPALPLAAVPSPTPPGTGTVCRPPPLFRCQWNLGMCFCFPLCTPAHCARENARRCIADTAQLPGLEDPRPRPGMSRIRSRRVSGQLPREEEGAPWKLQIHDPSQEAGRVDGGEDGLGMRHRFPASRSTLLIIKVKLK